MQLILPTTLAKWVQAKFISDFRDSEGIWEVLLVGKYKQCGITKFIL